MNSIVYFGSARQTRLEVKEALPSKLDVILERLNLRERVKGETVAVKMHTGNTEGYNTVHPVFVRKVIQAIKDGGGAPFVTDVWWDTQDATLRGYTPEILGCPVISTAGLHEKYAYMHEFPFKNLQTWGVAGMIQDASFLVNLTHIKGHPSCGFGGCLKNIALGCMVGDTRSAMHDAMHYDPYWFPDLCPDEDTRQAILASCPHGGLVQDKQDARGVHLHPDNCNACGRCLKVAPPGSLKIDPANFSAFQEACAISAKIVMSTFEPGKAVHLSLATHMSPVCDCFGFTSLPILPDVGIFGSDDIVAIDQAVLDMTADCRLLEENLPAVMEVVTRQGHPFSWITGPLKDPYLATHYAELYGLGSRTYELVDIMPLEKVARSELAYIPSHK